MQKLDVWIEGEEIDDLVLGLEAVTKSVKGGNWEGFNRNETGRYSFKVDDINES